MRQPACCLLSIVVGPSVGGSRLGRFGLASTKASCSRAKSSSNGAVSGVSTTHGEFGATSFVIVPKNSRMLGAEPSFLAAVSLLCRFFNYFIFYGSKMSSFL